MSKIIIICGWCGKPLGEKDGQGVEGESHGICDDCLIQHFPDHADKVRDILEVDRIEEIYAPHRKVRIVPDTKIHRT